MIAPLIQSLIPDVVIDNTFKVPVYLHTTSTSNPDLAGARISVMFNLDLR